MRHVGLYLSTATHRGELFRTECWILFCQTQYAAQNCVIKAQSTIKEESDDHPSHK